VEITKEDGAVTTLSVERDIERERGKECVCVCEREREREREREIMANCHLQKASNLNELKAN
jgi:hypothetical protein